MREKRDDVDDDDDNDDDDNDDDDNNCRPRNDTDGRRHEMASVTTTKMVRTSSSE